MIWEQMQRGSLRDIFGAGQAVSGAAQAVGAVGAAGIQAGATISAANTEADAAKYGANLQSQAAANSLAFNQNIYSDTKANEAPFVAAGQGAINSLASSTAPGGSLNTPYTQQFTAPTPTALPSGFQAPAPFSFSGVNETNDPAYQFDLQQGQQAVQRSAAAQGGLVSGGALKDLDNYSQGVASNQYQQSYQNAANLYQQNYANSLGTYQTNYANTAQQNQQNYTNALQNYNTAYNVFQNNQTSSFNRQAAVAGIGQTSTAQLGQAGAAAAGNYSQTAATGASGAANYLTQGATAAGAGTVGVANALSGGINNALNAYNSFSLFEQRNPVCGRDAVWTARRRSLTKCSDGRAMVRLRLDLDARRLCDLVKLWHSILLF